MRFFKKKEKKKNRKVQSRVPFCQEGANGYQRRRRDEQGSILVKLRRVVGWNLRGERVRGYKLEGRILGLVCNFLERLFFLDSLRRVVGFRPRGAEHACQLSKSVLDGPNGRDSARHHVTVARSALKNLSFDLSQILDPICSF